MPVRMQQVVIGTVVLGAALGLFALSRSPTTTAGSLVLLPVVLFPYVILGLTSRAARASLSQAILFGVALLFVGATWLTLSPSTDAQGGLIVVVVPLLQGTGAVAVYVVLRLFGAISTGGEPS